MTQRLTARQIAEILPQGPPILMLDEIVIADDGEVVGRKLLASEWYQGLGLQEFPAIYFIEIAMQAMTCALLMNETFAGKYVIFGGIKRAEFFERPTTGEVLSCTVRIDTMLRDRGGVFTFSCDVGGRVLAEGSVRFGFVEEHQLLDHPELSLQDLSRIQKPGVLTFDQMQRSLHSAFPQLLLTRLTHDEPLNSLTACTALSGDSLLMQGHFRRIRTLNGLYLMQMCEQMVGVATSCAARLKSVQRFEFKKFNHPGDLLLIEMSRSSSQGPEFFEVHVFSENSLSAIGILEIAPH